VRGLSFSSFPITLATQHWVKGEREAVRSAWNPSSIDRASHSGFDSPFDLANNRSLTDTKISIARPACQARESLFDIHTQYRLDNVHENFLRSLFHLRLQSPKIYLLIRPVFHRSFVQEQLIHAGAEKKSDRFSKEFTKPILIAAPLL